MSPVMPNLRRRAAVPRAQKPIWRWLRAIRRCARSPKRWPRRFRPRTARCSRCPTPARSNGTSRTSAGSSRRSCSGEHAADYAPFDPAFRVLFNSYYNSSVGDRHPRPERGLISRPRSADGDAPIARTSIMAFTHCSAKPLPAAAVALIELGLQHEQQHQELILTDIKHLLSRNPERARLSRALAVGAGPAAAAGVASL